METITNLIQRWDIFLEKIETRYLEFLQQAEEVCLAQLEETNYDYYTVFRSWQGIKSQIANIIPKIDETWNTKVQPEMAALCGDNFIYETERRKASQLADKLHLKMERFQNIFLGRLSQKYYNHAITIANQNFNCSQCAAPVTIKKNLFRAHYVTCKACNSVNTFEPETKYALIDSSIINNIVAMQCLPLQDTMQKALDKIRELRFEQQTDEVWDSYTKTYFNYWETFFKERIKLKPDAQERYEKDMERKQIELEKFVNVQRCNKYHIK